MGLLGPKRKRRCREGEKGLFCPALEEKELSNHVRLWGELELRFLLWAGGQGCGGEMEIINW